jgi:ubiquinone/menaquinone biosynthesis C-methylase UbiE
MEKHSSAIIQKDALDYLLGVEDARFDIVASGHTLHNFFHSYRNRILREIFRVLKPGGSFVNADKYLPEGQERYGAHLLELGRFFGVFVPIGKYDLLKEWVLHNVADLAPDRAMTEKESIQLMEKIGYNGIQLSYRCRIPHLVGEWPAS